jgi:hypothetical protein
MDYFYHPFVLFCRYDAPFDSFGGGFPFISSHFLYWSVERIFSFSLSQFARLTFGFF